MTRPVMRKLLILLLAAAFIGAGTAYAFWLREMPVSHYLSDLGSTISEPGNAPGDTGNLLALNPALFPSDYQDPERLRLKLSSALDNARAQGLLTNDTLVALPEHIGTWLMLRNEKPEIYRARSLSEAQPLLILSNPVALLRTWLFSDKTLPLSDLILRMKAQQAAADYQQLFSSLAAEYRVTLQAGSILLPEPSLKNGKLHTGYGALRNVGMVFKPDGTLASPLLALPWPVTTDSEQTTVQLGERHLLLTHQSTQLDVAGHRALAASFLQGRLWPLPLEQHTFQLTPDNDPRSQTVLVNRWLSEG